MSRTVKRRIFDILEGAPESGLAGKLFTTSIMTLITLNVFSVILETIEVISAPYDEVFKVFEIFSVAVFTIEYFLRIWSCTSEEKYKHPVKGRLRFALTPMAIVDLLAILPFYLPRIIPLDLRFIRALRLFRLFRLFKMARYSQSLRILGNVLMERKEELILTGIVVLILLVLASTLMYHVEHDAQPGAFSSIPAAMWWGVITLTTVGYGDVYPVTTLGKLLGTMVAILGIGMFALPAGILGSGFVEEIQKKRRHRKRICPHCGKDIDEPAKGSSDSG